MKFSRILVILFAIIMSAIIFAPATTVNAAITVDNATNTIAVDSACSLAEAIENANNDAQTHVDCVAGSGADTLTFTLTETVTLTGSAFPASSNLSGTQAYYPDITSEITIDEPSFFDLDFSSLGNVRVFNVMATGNLTLEGVGILNSSINPASGFDARGGAIYVNDGTLSIAYSMLGGNSATGIDYSGPNYAQSAFGGAIYATVNSTIVSLISVTLANNSANGGNNLSAGDGAEGAGGAIYTLGSIGLLDNVTVSGNSAIGGPGRGGGKALGGGIHAQSVTNVINSRFDGNNATGGTANSSAGSSKKNTQGGALFVHTATYISNVQFESNTAVGADGNNEGGDGQGGAIYASTTIATLRNSTFIGNSATGGNANAILDNVGGAGQGGAIYANGGTFNNLTVYNNTATGGTGDTNGNGNGGGVSATNVTINHNTFLDNSASSNGDNINSRGSVTLTASVVTSVTGNSDCSGSITDGGNNLRQDGGENSCPAIGTVTVGTHIASAPADNGCATTAAGSCISTITALDAPVIDGTGGTCASVNNADGRGFGRNLICDVGAYESATATYADIAITKAVVLSDDYADIGLYNPGDTVAYTLIITNPGPNDVSNLVVADTAPTGVTFANWTAAFTGLATGNASGAGDLNETVSIPVNGTVTYIVTGVIIGDATGTITNTATANDTILSDPDTTNNTATADFDVTNGGAVFKAEASILSINQVVDEGNTTIQATIQLAVPAEFGDTGDVTVTVEDAGTGDATSDADYTAFAPVTLTFSGPLTPGSTPQQTVNIDIIEDAEIEDAETLALTITDVTGEAIIGQPDTHTIAINDNDPSIQIAFDPNIRTAGEGEGTITVTVSLWVPPGITGTIPDIEVNVFDSGGGSASTGSDYAVFPLTTLTFSGLEAFNSYDQTVEITLLNDSDAEGTETVNLMMGILSGPADITTLNYYLIINDDDGGFAMFVDFNLQELQYYIDREVVNNPDIVGIEQALAIDFDPDTDSIMLTVRTTAGTVGNAEVNVSDTGAGFVTFSLGDFSITDADFETVMRRELLMLMVDSIDQLLYDKSGLNLDGMTVKDTTIQAQISR